MRGASSLREKDADDATYIRGCDSVTPDHSSVLCASAAVL
jgi:hypothetical protein